jgi:hypothetical protein
MSDDDPTRAILEDCTGAVGCTATAHRGVCPESPGRTGKPAPEPDEADQYRNAVAVAVVELEKLGMIDRVDGKPDGPATLNATGAEALTAMSYLVTFLGAMTYDADESAVRLAHHVSVAFGQALTALFASIGDDVDPVAANRAYQHALTSVRHLKWIGDA